jgi:small-conductance mechanosensitive channel
MHMAISKPIRVGDFVELETGTRGTVEDIGWRSTRIRDLPNNLVIVPNARLVEMVLTNYSLPVPEQSLPVQVGVAYGSDLEHVERVTLEVAKEVLNEVPGAVAGFEPAFRYHTLADSAIELSAVLRVQQFSDRALVTHEFIKRLHRRFAEEGIEIPFPQRVLHGSLHTVAGPVQPDKRR